MIAIVGDAGWDYLYRVKKLPAVGGTVLGELAHEGPAGGSANSAAWAASLGTEVTLIAAVGDDAAGTRLEAACERVPRLHAVLQRAPGRTQVSSIFLTPDGERTLVVGRSSVPLRWSRDLIAPVADAAVVCLNVEDENLRGRLHAHADPLRVLPLAHLREEARAGRPWDVIVGSRADHEAPPQSRLQAVRASICVLTEGESGGAFFTPKDGWQRYYASRATMVIDPTGAGDAFLGGLLAGLDATASPSEAVDLAAFNGARAVKWAGAWPPEEEPQLWAPIARRRQSAHAADERAAGQ